jgi:hypothetical protein
VNLKDADKVDSGSQAVALSKESESILAIKVMFLASLEAKACPLREN